MLGLITDRSQENVNRCNLLSAKKWAGMTAAERAEWTGNPLTAADFGYDSPVNLLPNRPLDSAYVDLKYRSGSFTVTSTAAGANRYAVVIVGNAVDFAGKTVTLSLASVYAVGGTPRVSLCWHDDTGYESTEAALSAAGSVTVALGETTKKHLALYVYVTSDVSAEAGALVRYNKLMLELGNTAHSYVPYTPILPTNATKGAYNYSDLNRVETAVTEIAELLGLELVTKTDWTLWDMPSQAELDRYISNITAIRNACPNKSVIPTVPHRLNGLTYETANAIEKILAAAYSSANSMYRAGELFTGEV